STPTISARSQTVPTKVAFLIASAFGQFPFLDLCQSRRRVQGLPPRQRQTRIPNSTGSAGLYGKQGVSRSQRRRRGEPEGAAPTECSVSLNSGPCFRRMSHWCLRWHRSVDCERQCCLPDSQ